MNTNQNIKLDNFLNHSLNERDSDSFFYSVRRIVEVHSLYCTKQTKQSNKKLLFLRNGNCFKVHARFSMPVKCCVWLTKLEKDTFFVSQLITELHEQCAVGSENTKKGS